MTGLTVRLGTQLNRLNGWQRIWLLAVLLWLPVSLTISAMDFPTRDKFETQAITTFAKLYEPLRMDAENQHVRCQQFIAQSNYRDALPCMKLAGAARQEYQEMMDGAMRRYGERVDRELLSAQAIAVAKAFGVWLVPSVLLYLLGIGVSWALKGFKGPKS